jgi:hypothetical protein
MTITRSPGRQITSLHLPGRHGAPAVYLRLLRCVEIPMRIRSAEPETTAATSATCTALLLALMA